MITVSYRLGEDTRKSTILMKGTCYDLHMNVNQYFICSHGTYNIVAIMEKEFYEELVGEE